MKQKFIAVRPSSLGQARRIEGVTPAALALIVAHARRVERQPAALGSRRGREPAAGERGRRARCGSAGGAAPCPCFT